MSRIATVLSIVMFVAGGAAAQDARVAASAPIESPALTIYNQNFAVVRQNVRLDLKSGVTPVRFSDVTARLEPDSVVLRDPSGKRLLMILEQNYEPDPISQEALLRKYEGQTIDFLVTRGDRIEVVKGRIVRAGFVMPSRSVGAAPWFNSAYTMYGPNGQPLPPEQPVIEVDGQLRFMLPGVPLFPALGSGTILKPTLEWKLQSDGPGPLNAEVSYVTGGMTWKADYNVIAPESGSVLDFIGWVTMDNDSGRAFENARIKLMAGDVHKVPPPGMAMDRFGGGVAAGMAGGVMRPPVTEKAFDEYHLYTLERPATLLDHETKQVEFLHSQRVKSDPEYVYDGLRFNWPQGMGYSPDYLRQNRDLGSDYQPKIWVMQKIVNSKANGLGMPLPKGRVRFYRRDSDNRLEFIGENDIDHTPADETLRIYTGNAFDMAGQRLRTNFRTDYQAGWIDESFEIKVRNHKTAPVKVTVVEHLYRGAGWAITASSTPFNKISSDRVEFPVTVPAGGEQTVTYTVHYTW